jgi:hypothetical protein
MPFLDSYTIKSENLYLTFWPKNLPSPGDCVVIMEFAKNVILNLVQDLMNSTNYETLK